MMRTIKNKIHRKQEFPGDYHEAKLDIPNDPRDVLAYIWKPTWHEADKKFILMKTFQVIHYEKKSWWMDGRAMKETHVLRWCEMPDGWQN